MRETAVTIWLPHERYSGACSHNCSNFSGYSAASVASPTPATARPIGRRPVANRNAPAPSDPKINARFQLFILPSGCLEEYPAQAVAPSPEREQEKWPP